VNAAWTSLRFANFLHLARCPSLSIADVVELQVWAPSDVAKAAQRFVLESQVKLAKELSLPLNVHSRSAGTAEFSEWLPCLPIVMLINVTFIGKPTIDLLQKANASSILMHAFDGRAAYAVQAVKSLPSCYFSVPASIVRAPSFAELAKQVPLDRLCLETDSPALHPVKGPRSTLHEPLNPSLEVKF
jgi:TatD DNase family protein